MTENLETDLGEDEPLAMGELLTETLMALVECPDQVRVETVETNMLVGLTVHCAPKDRGIVIGRQGANINALRVLFGHMAAKTKRRVSIEVAESRIARRAS